MPSSDYASTVKGGLKLKGGAKDAGVKKKKKSSSSKKDKSAQTQGGESSAATGLEEKRDPAREDEESGAGALERNGSDGEDGDEASKTVERRSSSERALTPAMGTGKTETQLRHEEIRRKRLDERLKREGGAKTHKQRVEELNKYLSGLSEHHDMPRIGPG